MRGESEPVPEPSLTSLLDRANNGEPHALNAVFERTYKELKAIAQNQLANLPAKAGLDATAVVGAACERLMDGEKLKAENRRHFFFILERAIHDVLVEHARHELAAKRGGGWTQVAMIDMTADGLTKSAAALEVQAAVEDLQATDPDAAQVVKLRYFCGLSIQQTAEVMDCSFAVARSHWDYGKAWLHERLAQDRNR